MSLAQRIRDNVARSRRTTSEILGTAAVLVQGHEEILQQLNTSVPPLRLTPWTIAAMKQEFDNFKIAQKHFLKLYGIRACSWQILVERINTVEAALVHLGYRQRR